MTLCESWSSCQAPRPRHSRHQAPPAQILGSPGRGGGSPHLGIQGGDLLLVGGGSQEVAHLSFQGVIHLHVNVVAGRLLLVIGVHAGRKQGVKGTSSASEADQPSPKAIQVSQRLPQGAPKVVGLIRPLPVTCAHCCFELETLQHLGPHILNREVPTALQAVHPPYLMVWLMMMGSGCCRSPANFMGISEKRIRTQLKIWRGRAEHELPMSGAPSTHHRKG